jgi:hypothetical protein
MLWVGPVVFVLLCEEFITSIIVDLQSIQSNEDVMDTMIDYDYGRLISSFSESDELIDERVPWNFQPTLW